MKIDWYTVVRRLSLIVFILLTIWGVIQASGRLAFEWGLPPYFRWDHTFYQFFYVGFWPITIAPLWYKLSYFLLGFWLLLPYLIVLRD